LEIYGELLFFSWQFRVRFVFLASWWSFFFYSLFVRPFLRPVLLRPIVGAGRLQTRCFSASTPDYLPRGVIETRILSVVKAFEKVDASKVSNNVAFTDLGLDSLDSVELVMAIEEEFAIQIKDEEAEKLETTADAIAYLEKHPFAK